MRKTMLTAAVLGVSLSFMGCPPPKEGGDEPANGNGEETSGEETSGEDASGEDASGEDGGGEDASGEDGGETAPADGGGEEPDMGGGSEGPDLSHVKKGQKYVYELQNNDMKQEWLVKEVGDASVTYEITTIMDMGQGPSPVGEAQTQEWKAPQMTDTGGETTGETANAETSRETMTVGGVEFDVLVTASEQGGMKSKTWTPVTGDVPTFPGVIKTQSDGNVTMELVSIEQP